MTKNDVCSRMTKVINLNDINILSRRTMLYDFYGELLTPHQKEIYESFVIDDIALVEIAQEKGISRQSVHDLVKRCDKALNDYEEKLQLVAKFEKTKELVNQINLLAKRYQEEGDARCIEEICNISNEILDNM